MYVYVRMHVLTQHRWYGHFIFYAMNMSDAGPGANTCMLVYRGLSYIELSYVSYTLDAFHSLYLRNGRDSARPRNAFGQVWYHTDLRTHR